MSNFEFIATNENADLIISAYFGVLYKDYPKSEFIIISHDRDYSALVNYFSGLKISISQQKICEQKSKKQNEKSQKQNKNQPAKNASNTPKQTVVEKNTSKTEQKVSKENTKTIVQNTEKQNKNSTKKITSSENKKTTTKNKTKKAWTIDASANDILGAKKKLTTKKGLSNQIKQKYGLSDSNAGEVIKKLESDGIIEITNNKITWKNKNL